MTLVGLPKNPMVAGCKIFTGIPRDEEEEVHLVEQRRVVRCKKMQEGKSNREACVSSNGTLLEASGGWCQVQGSSGTWTWPVVLNRSSRWREQHDVTGVRKILDAVSCAGRRNYCAGRNCSCVFVVLVLPPAQGAARAPEFCILLI
ncbi:hypothetical protein A2U01_0035023, partial [Trifolium medium]|nr:hypothetical protein [Trifolium medium]